MDEKQFDFLIQQAIKKNIQKLYNQTGQPQTIELSPIQTLSLQKHLNENKPPQIKGYIFDPIRGQDQILYKTGLNKQEIETFNEYEQKILLQFHNQLDFVPKKISQKQFHYFLTLEQLRRQPLSKYFMAAPDPIYLQIYDLDETITESLDIRTIASKVLRRSYKTDDDFQVDMVSMIHNFRLAFLNDTEMYDISIKFQKLFWENYTDYSPEKPEFITSYQYLKKRCTPAKRYTQKKKYTIRKKSQLANEFMRFSSETRVKFIIFLENKNLDKERQMLESSGTSDISQFKDQFYEQLEKFIKIQREINRLKKIKDQEMRLKQSKMKKKVIKQKKTVEKKKGKGQQPQNSQDDIYYGDSEEDVPQLQQQMNPDRQTIKHMLDEIDIQDFYFDSDQFD